MSAFSIHETKLLHEILKNPKEDYQKIVTLFESKISDITDRKKTQQKIKESEEKYKDIYRNIPIPGYTWQNQDGEMILVDYNEAAEKITRGMVKNILGSKALDYYSDRPDIVSDLFKCFKEKKNISKEMEYTLKTVGLHKFFAVKYTFVSPDLVLVYTEDITKSKEAEQKLKQSEKKFRVLFENSTSGIAYHRIVYDSTVNPIDYIITDVNPQYEIILSLKKKDVINRRSTEIYQVESAPYLDVFSHVAETGESRSIETYFSPMDKNFNVSVISPTKGEFITVFDDISERKKAEQKLKESENKIKEQNRFLAKVFESLNHPFYVININDYTIEMANTTANFSKISSDTTCYALTHQVNKPCKGEHICPLEEVKKTRKPVVVEHIHYDVDNNFKNVEIHAFPIFDGNGNIIQMIEYLLDITERKKTEQNLKESEEKFRTLTEQSVTGISIIQDNQIKYINQTLANYIGYTREEVEKWPSGYFLNLFHPDFKDFLIKTTQKNQSGQGLVPTHKDTKLIKKNGEPFWIELFARSITFNGKPAAMNISVDITERKVAEQKLIESEKKYRELVENANSIIIKMDKDANIIFINEYGEKFFEFNKAEILGRNVIGTIVPKTESSGRDLQQMVNEVFQHSERFERNENENITKSGKKVWVSWANKAIKDENDKFIGILSVGTDITEKRITDQKLKESEENFRTITEDSHLAITILQDDLVKYTNQKMADMFGYDRKEMMTWTPKEYAKTVAEDSLEFVMEQARKKQIGDFDVVLHYPIHVVKKSGEKFWVDNISTTIMYNNRPADLVTIMDITEKRKAEQVLKNEMKRLKEIDQIKEDLVNRISHEIKTPLISIYSTSDFILNNYPEKLDEKLIDLIKIIYEGGERLKTLVDNLMDIYLLESHELKLNSKPTNLIATINKAILNNTSQLKRRKQKLQVNLPIELIIKIDEKRIQQVISNILLNSIKNTPPKGSIFIELSENRAYVDIKIKDTGIGFTKEEKEKLFNKFGKIERFGKGFDVDVEGPGLGLYIANELVKLHKGEILPHSEGRHRGSTFIIRLPSER